MARGAISVGLSMVGVLLLGGCTGSAEAGPTPSVSALETGTPSPSPTATPGVGPVAAPVRPAEMEQSDEVGAAAAAEYFLALYEYVMISGDLDEWDRVTWGDCGFCGNVRDDVTRVYDSGGRYTGGHLTLQTVDASAKDGGNTLYDVNVTYAAAAGGQDDAAGAEVAASAAESGSAVVTVSWVDGAWVLLEVGSDGAV